MRALWLTLLKERLSYHASACCIMGNFNVVCSVQERMGVSMVNALEIDEFCQFIDDMEVVDLAINGCLLLNLARLRLQLMGAKDFGLKEKLKFLKSKIKVWNRREGGGILCVLYGLEVGDWRM
ncbi:hypothetical protein RIF29_19915 [Crotalaria pallida]|uniref:Uncharacterized protein n=1 Tax=Crotalaria pallida TaxID=3830 RepID=A0AAN9I4J9_CROPI